MTQDTAGPQHPETGTRTARTPVRPASLGRTVHSELVKIRTLRSTRMLLATVGACIVGFGVAGAVGVVVTEASTRDGVTDPLRGCLGGIGAAQLLALALGVTAATSENGSGTISSTLTAQPRRRTVAAAKTAAVAAVTATVAVVAVLTTFAANTFVLAGRAGPASLPDPEVWRALLGAVLGLVFVATLGAAFGQLVHSTAGAVAAAVGMLYLPGLLVLLLPPDVGAAATRYTPAAAGSALVQLRPGSLLGWPAALGVLLAYLAVVSACGTFRLARRDV